MDLSNISLTNDPDTLAAHAAAVDEAAEDLESALGRFINAYLEYIDRIWPDEAARDEAHTDLATLRADMTAARAAFDGLIFGTTEQTTEQTTAASLSASSPASSLVPRPPHGEHGGYANAETLSVVRCLSSDQRADEAARAIVATAWWNASDEIAADSAAIVAPRADAAEALCAWLAEEENPLADSASLFADLLTHALDCVNWGEVADHFAPKPLPSLEPLATAEEEPEGEGDPDEEQTPPNITVPSAADAAWIDYTTIRNHYHNLPHNAPAWQRKAAHDRLERAIEALRRAEAQQPQPEEKRNAADILAQIAAKEPAIADLLAQQPQPEGEEEEPEEEGDPDADGAATTDPADFEPGYLSADEVEKLRRARGNRRFFH